MLNIDDAVSPASGLRGSEMSRPAIQHLLDIIEGSSQALVVHRGGAPLFVNSAMAKLVGIGSREELLAEPSILPFLHPDDRAMVGTNVRDRLAGRSAPTDYEFRLLARDGGIIWVDCRASVIEWSGGPAVLAALFDINARKEALQAQTRSEALLARAFTATPEMMALQSMADGRYVKVNDAFCRMLGRAAEDLVGRTPREIGVWANDGFDEALRSELAAARTVRMAEATMRPADGGAVTVELSAEILELQGDALLLMVGRDVTLHRLQEEDLRRSKQEAELANRTKSEFLANMSHELRTPLNAVLGFSQVMRDELLGPLGTPRYREYADDIHRSGALLLNIINDVLDLAKLEAGKVELREETFSLPGAIRESARLVRDRAREGDLTLDLPLSDGDPWIVGDERLIKQVVLNLLSNAVKFTPPGGRVSVRIEEGASGAIVIHVADTGIGMSEEDIPRALAPFGQIDSAFTRRHAGTGLGLPLAKSLVELHGGDLTIRSGPGEGTDIAVTIPTRRVRSAERGPSSPASGGVTSTEMI